MEGLCLCIKVLISVEFFGQRVWVRPEELAVEEAPFNDLGQAFLIRNEFDVIDD